MTDPSFNPAAEFPTWPNPFPNIAHRSQTDASSPGASPTNPLVIDPEGESDPEQNSSDGDDDRCSESDSDSSFYMNLDADTGGVRFSTM